MSNVKKLMMTAGGATFEEPAQWYGTQWLRTNLGTSTQDATTGHYEPQSKTYRLGTSNAYQNARQTEAQAASGTGTGSPIFTGGNATLRFTDAGGGYTGAACGNRYVAWAYEDSYSWTVKQYTVSNTGWEDLCYTGTRWFMVGRSGDVRSTAPVSLGSAWPSGTTDHESAIKAALSNRTLDFEGCASDGNGTVVAVGTNANNDEGVVSTNDCSTWTKITDLAWSANTIRSVRYANNLWVVVGTNGKIYTATNPTSGNWTDVSSNYPSSSETLDQVFYDTVHGLWWVYGGSANCRYTSDFSSWSGNIYSDAVSSAGVSYGCGSVAVGESAIVIYGGNGRGVYGPL